jgi:hypothetical protein
MASDGTKSRRLIRAMVGTCCFLIAAGTTPAQQPVTNDMDGLDRWQERMSENVVSLANNIDSFFADDRVIEESGETYIRVSTEVRFEDGQQLTGKLSLKGSLALPYLENRFQVFVDSDGRERDLKEGLDEVDEVTEDDKSVFTGIRFVPRETPRTRVSVDGGLRWYGGPSPFVRLRTRRIWEFDEWAFRATHRVYWFQHRGFGTQLNLDFDRWLDDSHFFRYTPSAIWSEESSGVDWRQSFSVYHYITDNHMIGAVVDVQGITHPTFRPEKYEATLRWRQQTKRDWIFFEVRPGLAFPRDNEFQPTVIVTFKMDFLFGDEDLPWTVKPR